MRRIATAATFLSLLLSLGVLGCAKPKSEPTAPQDTLKTKGLRQSVVEWTPDENYEPYEQAKRHEVDPPPAEPGADPNAGLSEEQRTEKARTLFQEAEALAEQGKWSEAKAKYEEAYHLTPGRHGLALKVGMAAIEAGDCEKAKRFLEHFIIYGDLERQESLIHEALRAHRGLACWHN